MNQWVAIGIVVICYAVILWLTFRSITREERLSQVKTAVPDENLSSPPSKPAAIWPTPEYTRGAEAAAQYQQARLEASYEHGRADGWRECSEAFDPYKVNRRL